jgi:hypothetical protein
MPRQMVEVVAYLAQNQVGTLWIADEQVEQAVAGLDQEAVSAEVEVEPCLGRPLGYEIDHLDARKEQDMVANGPPANRLWQRGEMPGAVLRPFVDESHGARKDNGCR